MFGVSNAGAVSVSQNSGVMGAPPPLAPDEMMGEQRLESGDHVFVDSIGAGQFGEQCASFGDILGGGRGAGFFDDTME